MTENAIPYVTQPATQQTIEVEVDFQKLDLDDLLLIEDFQAGRRPNLVQLTGFLERVIVGGIRHKHYKLDQIGALFEAVTAAMTAEANPVDAEGKASSSG